MGSIFVLTEFLSYLVVRFDSARFWQQLLNPFLWSGDYTLYENSTSGRVAIVVKGFNETGRKESLANHPFICIIQ